MRWCQKCTTSHALSAFDGDKRSCRAQLNIHNERRRQRIEGAGKRAASAGAPPGAVRTALEGGPPKRPRPIAATDSAGSDRLSTAMALAPLSPPFHPASLPAKRIFTPTPAPALPAVREGGAPLGGVAVSLAMAELRKPLSASSAQGHAPAPAVTFPKFSRPNSGDIR